MRTSFYVGVVPLKNSSAVVSPIPSRNAHRFPFTYTQNFFFASFSLSRTSFTSMLDDEDVVVVVPREDDDCR